MDVALPEAEPSYSERDRLLNSQIGRRVQQALWNRPGMTEWELVVALRPANPDAIRRVLAELRGTRS